MFCERCGQKLEGDERYCSACGASVPQEQGSGFVPASVHPLRKNEEVVARPSRPKSRKAALIAGCVIAALAVVAVGGFFIARAVSPSYLFVTFVNDKAFPDAGLRAWVASEVDKDGNGLLLPHEMDAACPMAKARRMQQTAFPNRRLTANRSSRTNATPTATSSWRNGIKMCLRPQTPLPRLFWIAR